MGDRGIVVLEFSEGFGANIGIYTHWHGSSAFDLASSIAESKVFRSRLGDETGYGVFPILPLSDPSLLSDGAVEVVVNMRTGDVSTV